VKIDGKQEVKVATTIVIEAGTSIELKVGASSIKIEAAKITVKSARDRDRRRCQCQAEGGAMMEVTVPAP
jgi:type VI secretion system secreted protein VgrG